MTDPFAHRPTRVRVDLDALAHNLGAIRRHTSTTVMAIVKANAYGHGAARVGLALEAAGVSMLACADVEEGVTLRDAGVTMPVLVFGALSVSDLAGVFDRDLTPTVSTPAAARALEEAAAARGRRIAVQAPWKRSRCGLRRKVSGR